MRIPSSRHCDANPSGIWMKQECRRIDVSDRQSRAASPHPNVADMLAGHDRQSANQHHGPSDGHAFPGIIGAIESEKELRVVVFDSAVDG
jgi:hypothetical protein